MPNYGIKELFTNMIRYIDNQFVVERNNDASMQTEFRGRRVYDRNNYINPRLTAITKNFKTKSQVKVTTATFTISSIEPYSWWRPTGNGISIIHKEPNYNIVGIIGYNMKTASNGQYLNVFRSYISDSKTNKTQTTAKINFWVGNVCNTKIENISVALKILMIKNNQIDYPLKTVDLKYGYENK